MSITFTTIMPQQLQILLKKQQPGVIIHPLPNAWVETTGFRFLFQQACSSEIKNGKNHYRVALFHQGEERLIGRLDYTLDRSRNLLMIDKSFNTEDKRTLGSDGLGLLEEFQGRKLRQAMVILAFTHALSEFENPALFIYAVPDEGPYDNLNIYWARSSDNRTGEESLPNLSSRSRLPLPQIEIMPVSQQSKPAQLSLVF